MYLAYLVLSFLLTAYVARTLFRNGHVFLDDALGDERLAGSVNRLLVVGFWLLNLGYVGLAIRVSSDISTASSAVENLSIKLGLVLLETSAPVPAAAGPARPVPAAPVPARPVPGPPAPPR